jgi:hypothetical protein
MTTIVAWLDGIAFWSPRITGWPEARAVLRGEAEPSAEAARRPQPTLLAPTERRRAPDTVAIALEVAQRACVAADRDPKHLSSVFASTHGDLVINDYMCEALATPEPALSPTKFHNSVHNAAAGYWTIGTGCMAPATAMSAFKETFTAGLLEALTQVECERQPVLVVAYDIEATGPLATVNESRGHYGCAMVLSPEAGPRSTHRLDIEVVPRGDIDPVPASLAELFAGNPLAQSLALFEAIALEIPTTRTLALSRGLSLAIDVKPHA